MSPVSASGVLIFFFFFLLAHGSHQTDDEPLLPVGGTGTAYGVVPASDFICHFNAAKRRNAAHIIKFWKFWKFGGCYIWYGQVDWIIININCMSS